MNNILRVDVVGIAIQMAVNINQLINQGVIKELYFRIIHFNQNKSLNYQEMNVFFLVFFMPFFIYLLIIFNIELYIRNKKKQIV